MSSSAQALQQIQRIIAVITNMQKLYPQSSEPTKQRYINQAKQFWLSIKTIQQNLKIDDEYYQEITDAVNQANQLINDFTHPENKELEAQRINETTKFQSQLASTMNTTLNTTKNQVQMNQTSSLSNNIINLRNQINSIQNLINQTSEEADFTFQEQQNRIQTEDISSMAITKLKAQTKAENQMLKVQVNQLQQELNLKVSELKETKQLLIQTQSEKSNFESLYINNKKVGEKQKQTLQSLQQENKLLQEEITKLRGKYENNLNIQKIDQENTKREKQQLTDELVQVTAEKEMLSEKVETLQQQLDFYNQTDIETASNEVEIASKKILQLQAVIEQMRQKQEEQKMEYLRTINGLKTTIAALTEEDEGMDDQGNDSELIQQNKQLQEQVQTLTQQLQQSNIHQTTMMQSAIRKSQVHGAADKLLEGYKLNQSISKGPLRGDSSQQSKSDSQPQLKAQSIEDVIEESRRQ